MSEKVLILVDVQNVYYTTRQAYGRRFDYNKFWSLATSGRTVEKAIGYAVDRGVKKQIEFQNILRAIGFEIKLKPYISRSDGSSKGDWDVGITVDALEYCSNADVVVLVSGDGDFGVLVENLRNKKNKVVEVYGVPQLTANSLISAATKFLPIDDGMLLS